MSDQKEMQKEISQMSFEQALEALEEIVDSLESGNVALEELYKFISVEIFCAYIARPNLKTHRVKLKKSPAQVMAKTPEQSR